MGRNKDTEEAHVRYLEEEITLEELEQILHPQGRPVFPRAALQKLSEQLKVHRIAKEQRLAAAGTTDEQAAVDYLEGRLPLASYLALVDG